MNSLFAPGSTRRGSKRRDKRPATCMDTADMMAPGIMSKPVCCEVKCKIDWAKIGTANIAPYSATPMMIDSMLPAVSER